MTLTNCSLTDNTASNGGGIVNSQGTVTLTNCSLTDNTAADGSGGGIVNSQGTMTLTNCSLAHNTAPLNDGGGILNQGTMTLTDCTLAHNTAHIGGGIYNQGGTMTLTNCTLAHNVGGTGGGGGILNAGIMTLTDCTLTDNTTIGNGGGILNGGTMTLTNCTLAHNTGVHNGGGIANQGGLRLTNCTLAHNVGGTGGSGGSANQGGPATLQNTILALNTAPAAAPQADDCVGVVTSLGTNLIGDPTGCTITLQASDLTGDPGLGAFTDNGTPGNGHFPLLQETSQAIDAGNDVACPPTDQLGQPRVDQCDIGAIEFQPSDTTPPVVTIVSVTPDTLSPPNGRTVPVTIVATITDAGSGVDPSTTAYAVEDEYGSVEPSGSLTLGADGRYTATIFLQASRHGNDKNGREYTITVRAEDLASNEGSAATSVIVPHDQGQGRSIAAR